MQNLYTTTMNCPDMNVTLVSSDGITFTIPLKAANMSVFVSAMTDTYDDAYNEDEEIESIPVIRVTSKVLSMIVEFMCYYPNDPMIPIKKPLVSNHIGDVVQRWYAIFIERVISQDMLYDIVNAANYMFIQPLLELSCAAVAASIQQKNNNEIHAELYLTV